MQCLEPGQNMCFSLKLCFPSAFHFADANQLVNSKQQRTASEIILLRTFPTSSQLDWSFWLQAGAVWITDQLCRGMNEGNVFYVLHT